MSALKTMLQYGAGGGGTANVTTIAVYATNRDDPTNGGCCCAWTVPAGVAWFAVEMWGGGGGGAGTCCCHGGWPGGSGSYARKVVEHPTPGTTLEGRVYRLCAGGSTGCAGSVTGCTGCPSYIYGESEAANVVCAQRGSRGCSKCYWGSNCSYQGCSGIQFCTDSSSEAINNKWCGGFGISGLGGTGKGSPNCWNSAHNWAPHAPFTGGQWRKSKDGCSGICAGCCSMGHPHFPGGGGGTGDSHTNSGGCGAPGAGGLILIEYWTGS